MGNMSATAAAFPIIDTHIHLFDPNRPQGIPWPGPSDKILYHPALPERYKGISGPFGIAGAIAVECSAWPEDNQWLLDTAARNPIMVGIVGNLEPADAGFGKQFDRFHRSPLFLGIRYGNLWGRHLGAQLSNSTFVANLKVLAQAGLEMDSANPTPDLIPAVIRLASRVPELRIVVDHIPQFYPQDAAGIAAHVANLRELGKHPQVFIKISSVLRRVNGRVPTELAFYRERLDELFGIFGEDRVLFGSDWPNSDQWGTYPQVFKIVHEYFTAKGPRVAEKYFRKNSMAAYRWKPRG